MSHLEGRVSIVIPAYNAGQWIAEAVDSALAQDYPDVEVIVVDDASTDDTPAILNKYGDRIRTVRHDVNRGVAEARNTGMEMTTGEFIARLDHDDAYLPERISRCVAALRMHPAPAFVTTDAWVEDSTTGERFRYYERVQWPDTPSLADIARANFVFSAAVFPRTAHDLVGGFRASAGGAEDLDYWFRLMRLGWQPLLVDEPLAIYRRHGRNLSGDWDRHTPSHYEVLSLHLPAIARDHRDGLASPAYRTGKYLFDQSRFAEARAAFLIAARDRNAPGRKRARFAARSAISAAAEIRAFLRR